MPSAPPVKTPPDPFDDPNLPQPRYKWLGPLLAAYWLFIFAATHAPQAALPQTHLGDKTEHFLAYGILAVLLFAWLRFTRPRFRRIALPAVLICVAYAAVDELTQPIVNRYTDFRDFLADATGAAIGVLVGMIAFRTYRGDPQRREDAKETRSDTF
jgi:VanZ family protein